MFKKLFGSKTDFQELFNRGAVVIDVRTPNEYAQGAIPGSENIPLQQISSRMKDFKKLDVPVICVCASGMRSRAAMGQMKSAGVEAYNGGPWTKMIPFVED